MNFRYRKFPVDAKNCPFPNKKSALRPVIQIGQDEFFNKWMVKFEYQKENIDLREIVSQ